MTENVYVIKVKTKPSLSSLYPSERRYSASTVGGLSLVHFGLGVLSLLLGTLSLSLQGPILSAACLVPFVTGLLAWRRWYIDRNIAIFFYGSLFSLVAAILCFVVTIFDVAAASNSTGGSLWPLEKILDSPRYSLRPAKDFTNDTHVDDITSTENNSFDVTEDYDLLKVNDSSKLPVTLKSLSTELNVSNFRVDAKNGNHDDLTMTEASFMFEERMMISREIFQTKGATNITQGSMNLTKEKSKTFWRTHYEDSSHARMLLTLNVLMASLLEIFWSLLSAKIAFYGMMNQLPESGNVITKSKTRLPLQKRKSPAPKPDILDHDRRLSEALQNLQGLAGIGPRLPLPESNREYRERVERFLANQATHRIVEGA